MLRACPTLGFVFRAGVFFPLNIQTLTHNLWGFVAQVLDIMRRASRLGIQPNTIMYNTAMAALARALRWKEVQAIFLEMPVKDAISYETLVAAYGLVGDFENAERAVSLMIDAKFVPRDYTWNGLISAYR